MAVKKLGLGLLVVGLPLLLLVFKRSSNTVDRQPITKVKKEDQHSNSTSQATNSVLNSVTVPLTESPYPSLSTAALIEAKESGERWANAYQISDTWAVKLDNTDALNGLMDVLNSDYFESVAPFSDVFSIRIPGSDQPHQAKAIQNILTSHSSVTWFQQEIIETFALRYDLTPPAFSDPYFKDQWHLKNVGDRLNVAGEDSNIYPAWNLGASGAGIHIAIVDTGTEGSHPDLAPNYRDDLDYDYIDNDASAAPNTDDETHGTAVAGVAGAAANQSCGVGTAFNAELVSIRLIHEDKGVTSSRQASAVSHRSDLVDIYNNSWGPDTDNGARMAGPGNLAFSAMKNAIETGRDGLGAIYIWAAGNGRSIGSNVNYDGWAAHRYTIAVGSVGDHGKLSNYSEPGAPMLVVAHSNGDTSGIRTTDLQGSAGADPGDCRIDFGGTSSAAPLVAVIVALMLETNPRLTWRDVQQILAKTAVKVATTNNDWVRNGAGYWVNHNFGFGRVDAAAAVKVAQTLTPVKEEKIVSTNLLPLNQNLPDNSTSGIQAFHDESENIRIEHVSVTIDLDAVENETMDWGDLQIELTSPTGTKSILATPHTDAQKAYSEWTYWSARHLDEPSQGTWTLSIQDRKSGNQHIAKSWGIEFYGTEIDPDDNQSPNANRDSFTITESTSYLDVIANDTDQDGDILKVLSIYRSPHSQVTLLPSGLIEYTPGDKLGGRDRFGYTVHDGRGGIRTAEVDISIPRPHANDDQVATPANKAVSIAVLANDIDFDGDSMRIKAFSNPSNVTVQSEGLLNIKYTPDPDFICVDQFTYTVTDDIDGETSAMVTVYVTAESDFALQFDGDNDQVEIEGTSEIHLDSSFTIEAWIRPTSWGEGETGYGRVVDKDSYILYLHGTGFPQYNKNSLLISLDHSNGTRSVHNTPADSIKLNEWQHVAATYDNNSDVKLYINGIQQPLSVPFDQASGPLKKGDKNILLGESGGQARAFEGAIDELRIWNWERPGNEIASSRDETLDGTQEGLLIYFPMSEGQGSLLRNRASFQYEGTIAGAIWIRGIISGNSPPIPTTEEVEALINQKVVITVTKNVSDPDGDRITITKILNVSSGSASILNDSIIFEPAKDFTGIVRIEFEIDDGYNGTSISTLVLVIGEGLYYTIWEAKNYAGSLGSANNDSDFDNHSNFKEYAFGTDPLSGYQDPLLWNLRYDDETEITTFTYTVLLGSIDVSYKLQVSTDLKTWTIPEEDVDYAVLSRWNPTPDTETHTIAFQPNDGARVYVRLEAISLIGAQ